MPFRVLHLAPFYDPAPGHGGMARAAAGLCAALAARGHEVIVATARLSAGHPAEESRDGVHVHRFAGPAWMARALAPWPVGLRRFLRERRDVPDIVHVHGARSFLGREAPGLAVPWVVQPHGTFPHHGFRVWTKRVWDAGAGRRLWDGASALLALSQAEARDLPGPAVVVGSGVDLPPPRGAPSRGRSPRLVLVGSDHPQKRAAFAVRLLGDLPGVQLELIGPFGARFRRAAARQPRVSFAGVLDRQVLADRLGEADLLIHPAVDEAFGMAAFEAALAGLPAVVAGGHGCAEWLGRAGGCVVAPDDGAAWRDAVRARLDDPALGRAEAGAVAGFVRRELTWELVAERVESAYAEALATGPADRRRAAAFRASPRSMGS